MSDGPDEAGELTCHGTDRPLSTDPAAEVAVLVVKTLLAAPADLEYLRRNAVLALSQGLADRGLEPRVVRGLTEDVTEQPVAGLGDMPTTT